MLKRLPPVESLRILEACVRHANFTRAAREIGVTAAAISLRIRNLESQLGTQLFRRKGPRLAPTQAATVLANRMAEALRLMYTAVDECHESTDPLRVTAVPSFATQWLAPRLERYHEQPNAVPLQLDASIELRSADDFDVAIRTGSGHWPGFEATPLVRIDVTPMLSPALAASLRLASVADLARAPLLRHEDWPRWFREAGVTPSSLSYCAVEYSTYELDAAAAAAGFGVALLSPALFHSHVQDGRLVQPFAHIMRGPDWHYFLLKTGDTRPAVARLRSWLQSEACVGVQS